MKKRKNIALIVLIIFIALIIVGVSIFLILNNISVYLSDTEYNKISSSFASGISQESETQSDTQSVTEITSPSINENTTDNPVDFQSLNKQNDEIYSWIYIPDTNINYPVCQSKSDDNFYLNHDIYKNYSFPGAIYTQVCNSKDYSDRVTVLYGHNMANGSMFADLHKFENSSFFDSHKYIYVYTDNRKLTYEVVSAFSYDDRHIMNSFDFSDDEVFSDYLEMILNPHSILKNIRSGINLTTDDKIITLSTCLNSGEGRYLVQGVMINDERTK